MDYFLPYFLLSNIYEKLQFLIIYLIQLSYLTVLIYYHTFLIILKNSFNRNSHQLEPFIYSFCIANKVSRQRQRLLKGQ